MRLFNHQHYGSQFRIYDDPGFGLTRNAATTKPQQAYGSLGKAERFVMELPPRKLDFPILAWCEFPPGLCGLGHPKKGNKSENISSILVI